jgi:mono/diheme cytochrome c family protein
LDGWHTPSIPVRASLAPVFQSAICNLQSAIWSCSAKTFAFLFVTCITLTIGCQQDMARQPKYKPLQESDQFADHRSSRPLEPGTVPRGYLRADAYLYSGLEETNVSPSWISALVGSDNPWAAVALTAPNAKLVDEFPFPVTEEVMDRGQERFNIYCAVCHDRIGTGNGRIVQRGYVKPPSYHTERLRKAPVGHFFEVITHGYGAMPDYATQIPPADRWAIIAYVRALQESQNSRIDDVPADERKRLEEAKP